MELELSQIKALSFEILMHFSAFCRDREIPFYLSNGTLLGAVKYGGFIPWDDDIDVFVPREDYNRLLEIYEDSDRFRLFSREREPVYRYPFAKLCDMSTCKVEHRIDNGIELGVDIDIFPLDYCSAHILRPFVQWQLKIFQIGCILSKFTSVEGYPIYKQFVICCCRALGYGFFHRALSRIVHKESSRGSERCGCLMWPIYGAREIVPSEVFREAVEVTFEGERFLAPAGYDIYLRSLYGDYEEDPPPEKQRSHHNYTAYYK